MPAQLPLASNRGAPRMTKAQYNRMQQQQQQPPQQQLPAVRPKAPRPPRSSPADKISALTQSTYDYWINNNVAYQSYDLKDSIYLMSLPESSLPSREKMAHSQKQLASLSPLKYWTKPGNMPFLTPEILETFNYHFDEPDFNFETPEYVLANNPLVEFDPAAFPSFYSYLNAFLYFYRMCCQTLKNMKVSIIMVNQLQTALSNLTGGCYIDPSIKNSSPQSDSKSYVQFHAVHMNLFFAHRTLTTIAINAKFHFQI